MGLFGLTPDYNKEGAGINKDAKPKTGFALFWDNLTREFWSIWVVNVVFIVACLPIITIGPAIIALFRVLISMVRDQTVYPVRDFLKSFKDNMLLGLMFGIPFTLLLIVGFLINANMLFAGEQIATGEVSFSLAIVTFVWTFFTTSSCCYIIALLAYVELPFVPVVKNAIFLMFLGKFNTALAFMALITPAFIALIFIPIAVPLMPFIGFFSYPAFIACSAIWPVIDLYIIRGESTQQLAIKARKEKEAAEKAALLQEQTDNE